MAIPQSARPANDAETGAFEPGDRVGRFEILSFLGKGSMGVVYHARDPLIGREVAVKTLAGDFSVSAGELRLLRRRFLNEARSAGALRHPGIVTIYDVIEDEEGRVAIAMEYIEGQSLRDVLDDPEPLPMEFVARTVSEIAATLDAAHSRGIIHRDIKPANILLTGAGEIKVADFGIASLRGDDLAAELNALGTPNYLPPERILGHQADHRVDIYALGVILYEMLTRRLPFRGQTMGELARAIVQEAPGDPTDARHDLSASIVAILERVLDKDPERRFQSAGELARELKSALHEQAKLSDTVPAPHFEELDLVEPEAGEEETAVESRPEETAGKSPPRVPRESGPRSAVTAWKSVLGATPRLVKVLVSGVLALYVLGVLVVSIGALGGTSTTDAEAEKAAERLAEYQDLVLEAERLLDRGDFGRAGRAIDRASALEVEGAELAALRSEVERQRRARLEAERRAEASALFEEARQNFDRRDLNGTDLALAALFEVDAEHEGGLALSSAVAALRTALASRARPAPTPEPIVEEPPAETPAEPAAVFEAFEAVPIVARVDPFGTVRIEFLSERPKGVLTVYSEGEQILRKSFRFFERKGLMRRRGVSGGFDGSKRLPSGPLDLRVYLTLPGRAAQSRVVSEELGAGETRTLRIRVSQAGSLSVSFR